MDIEPVMGALEAVQDMTAQSARTMIWAVLITFFATLLIGPYVIKLLKRLRVGQNVYELAPEEHQKKQGMPTMGGLMFALLSLVAAFALRSGPFDFASDLLITVGLFALLNLGIGFADDMTKLRGKNNKGLSERQKLIGQAVVALLFSLYCYYHPQIGPSVIVPFFGVEWDLGGFYVPIMMFIIICTTNGANFLDGLDGLMGSVTSVVSGFFAVAAMLVLGTLVMSADTAAYANVQNIGVLCAAVCGALLGYLRFNLYPGQLMMGDTGSMYLGGIVAGAAMVLRMPLLIPIAGCMYAVSLLSTFIQRWYFRLTHGKRIFKMAPLHHHFELKGIPETRIVSMYAIVTVIACLIALIGIL